MNRTHVLLAASLFVSGAVCAAHAATREEQAKACRRDAIHFCAIDIPNKAKITACMERHLDELSPRCRAMFTDGDNSADKSANPGPAQ
ncbi:MAG TPA: hypothetical protein VF573_11875 [Paraburkholderia sp.]|uniref:hypothetical protein n=1 Tax=Paraburkholderia sp. TaxID=1926495 RepID=UPI002ED022B0